MHNWLNQRRPSRVSLINIYFEKCKIDLRKGANVLLNSWNNIDLTHVKEVGYKSQYQAAPLHRPQRTKFLTLASTKLLVQGVIMARIDYCNVLLYGVPAVHLSIEIATSSEFRSVTYHPYTQILSYFKRCLHCIGHRRSSEFYFA